MYVTKQTTPLDDEVAEEWVRDIDSPDLDIYGVAATKRRAERPWRWSVGVHAMEFVRDVPLEAEMRRRIIQALRAVPGVMQAEEEDREVWILRGEPRGDELVNAVAVVVDDVADRIRAHLASLR